MPAEMLASTCVSAPTSCPSSSASAGGSSAKGSNGGNGNNSRKERSCKGKRYLEMIGESKGGASSGCKRPKSNSVSAGSHATGDTSESSNSPTKSSHSHKWVSGGFDLEERIAALPQLQDTHLVNALNNNRRNTANGKTLERQNGERRSEHSSPSPTALVNGDAKQQQNYVNNNNGEKMRAGSEEKLVMAVPSPTSSTSTVCSGDEASDGDSRSSPIPSCPPPSSQQPSSKSAIIGAASASSSGPEFLSGSNFTSLTRSQGLDVGPCDGLTALAEVALSQAQAITTSSSS